MSPETHTLEMSVSLLNLSNIEGSCIAGGSVDFVFIYLWSTPTVIIQTTGYSFLRIFLIVKQIKFFF